MQNTLVSLTCWYTLWSYSQASHSSCSWFVHPKWDWETFRVHLLEWLHLVALGDRSCCGFLVTLGGCHHLDGLEQRRSIGMSWWLFLATPSVIVRGSCAFSPQEPQKATLVDCSWLVYPHLVLVLMAPLCKAGRVMPISAWATKWVCHHNEDVDCRQAIEPRVKYCVSCLIGILFGHLLGSVKASSLVLYFSCYTCVVVAC